MSLEGHKKVGQKFVTPLNQLGIKPLSYYREVFPELLWMGFIRERNKGTVAVSLIRDLALRTKEVRQRTGSNGPLNLSYCSSYGALTETEKTILRDELPPLILEELREALAPLTLYEGFSLAFLGKSQNGYGKDVLLNLLKAVMLKYADKFEAPGAFLQAMSVEIRIATGSLGFAPHMTPLDMTPVLQNLESHEAKENAGRIRNLVLVEAATRTATGFPWSKSFWNQGTKIDGCKLRD
jgi:hypothetical protein